MKTLLCTLLLLFCLGQTAQAKPPYFIDGGRLRSDVQGLSLPVPEGWSQGLTSKSPGFLAKLVRDDGRSDLAIFVTASSSNQEFPTSAQIEKDLVRYVRGFQVKKMVPWKLGGTAFQEYRAVGSAGSRQFSLFVGFANDRTYLFFLGSNLEDGEKARAEVLGALKGVKFIEASEKAPSHSTEDLDPV